MLMKLFAPILILSLMSGLACRSGSKKANSETEIGSLPAVPVIPPTPAASMDHTLFTTTLASVEHYLAFAQESEGFILGGESVKFFIDIRNPAEPKTYFINGNFKGECFRVKTPLCASLHHDFVIEQDISNMELLEFNQKTYLTQDRSFVAGTLTRYKLDGREPIFAIQLSPSDIAANTTILNFVTILRSLLPASTFPLAFVPTGDGQATNEILPQLQAQSVELLSIDTIMGGNNFRALHTGQAWGYLRVFPKNQDDLSPTDIVVFDELPLDLTVVAGVMTKAFQDTNSHVNLKSKERNTPNMILRNAGPENAELAPWLDKPVHLTISKTGWTLEATTPEIMQAKFQERQNKPWRPLVWSASQSLLNYKEMCPGSLSTCLDLGSVYGTKAANLGFLKELFIDKTVPRSAPLSYDPVPEGFGVPLQFYKDFMEHPANAAIKAAADELIAKEKEGVLTVAQRTAMASALRAAILNGEVPAAKLQAIRDSMAVVNPTIKKWKIRSSANAEDIENFDGAGLHDSYSSKTTTADNAAHTCILELDDEPDAEGELIKYKVKPKTVACAMKGVYASLWNKRAIEERSFARIDHATVAMGLSILPSYDTESPIIANSVVITRVINSPEIWGYTLSIQKGNNTVTNPSPGSWSEVSVARPYGLDFTTQSLSTVRYAKPTAAASVLTTTVLSREQTLLMASLAAKIETAYCKAKAGYYFGACTAVVTDSDKKKSIDMEMKYLENGQFVIKQLREFGGK